MVLACPCRPVPPTPAPAPLPALLDHRTRLIAVLREADQVLADTDAMLARAHTLQQQAETLRADLVRALQRAEQQIRDTRQHTSDLPD